MVKKKQSEGYKDHSEAKQGKHFGNKRWEKDVYLLKLY